MLYDSQCPLCMHEVKFLERRNNAGLVKFTDIASPDYNPADNGEVDYERGMKVIHAVLDSGEVVEGVAVFRHVYSALGLGWVWALTRLPGIGWVADRQSGDLVLVGGRRDTVLSLVGITMAFRLALEEILVSLLHKGVLYAGKGSIIGAGVSDITYNDSFCAYLSCGALK